MRAAPFAMVVAAAIALAGCGGERPAATVETPTQDAAATTPTPAASPTPAGTPTPDPALLRDGGIAIIEKAYARLLDEYIEPLDPSSLLTQAWAGVRQEAAADGLSAGREPALTGDRAGDFAAFRASYVLVAAAAGDATKLRYAALRQMASSLNDCHTFFLNPVASDTIVDTRAGSGAVGIGIDLAGIPPLVTEVIAGGPAERAGILVGDRVVSVDGADTSQTGPQSTFDLINGHEGSVARLQLRRPGESAPIEIVVTRERVTPRNIEARGLGDGIGYVRLRNFVDGGIATPLREALTGLEALGVTKWIIDLRGNPGGRLDLDAMSLFVKEGITVRSRGRDGAVKDERGTGATLATVRPTVLLVNNRTGSVAELFAAALQEYGVAWVVGEKSNGCVGFTDITPLGDGSSVAVTTDVNIGPVTGVELAGRGVVPDEAVPRTQSDISNARDPQLDAAVAHFGG